MLNSNQVNSNYFIVIKVSLYNLLFYCYHSNVIGNVVLPCGTNYIGMLSSVIEISEYNSSMLKKRNDI